MILVSRLARKLVDPEYWVLETPEAEDLQAFRSLFAWVLLGEPGAGKSTAFEQEAQATGGQWLRIAEFINADLDDGWKNKTLFLDGLDEIRASGGVDSTIELIRKQLKRLGNPPFRIACRAADWYGSTDRDDLKSVSTDRQITVLLLEPLSEDSILKILRENHGVEDPQAFIERAKKYGISDLLNNPQTLGLLADAVALGNQWPESRDETYRLACEKLAEEANKRQRIKMRGQPRALEQLLDAAGQLSAVLLLSDKIGFALDPESADGRFPVLADFSPPELASAYQVINSKLFRPEAEERVVPSHRSIAEYLAARWLARRIDGEGLPLGRVLNLLLGRDGRAVAGLRGLYGWLALHCHFARTRLIEADALTVVVYGDVKPMPLEDKRRILAGLRREAKQFTAFRRDVPAAHRFGALADAGLQGDFLAILNSPERDESSQAHLDCVLDILAEGEPLTELAPTLYEVIRDETRRPRVRENALQTWLKLVNDPHAKLALLEEIAAGRVIDDDDQLVGMLLRHLYPAHLMPDALLRHLHLPKNPKFTGAYLWFWIRELSQCIPVEHLPILLDGFVGRTEFRSHMPTERRFNQMADFLLVRGIETYGDSITDEQLFAWMGIGANKFGNFIREKPHDQSIANWLSARPERYKSLLALCFKHCEHRKHPVHCTRAQANRLHNATPPDDIGLWHLEQVSLMTNDELARLHLSEAVNALIYQRSAIGLSLDVLDAWGAANPERKHWLDPLLACEIPEWQMEMIARHKAEKNEYEQDRDGIKRDRTIELTTHIPAIRTGTARVDLMHQLASVWKNRFIDIEGETVAERFDNFCENGMDVLSAVEVGFKLCPERNKLPTVDEIIDANISQKEHLIRLPCLIGMELRWQQDPKEIVCLSDENLRRMIAFRLTDGNGSISDWFTHLAQERPTLFADVLIGYAAATLKAGQDFVNSIASLQYDPQYRAVAEIAVPRLLEAFPIRARSSQLRHLGDLLKTALLHVSGCLPTLVERKTTMKGMDNAQKVYWFATATLIGQKLESALWDYIGNSEVRANHLSEFLIGRFTGLNSNYEFSAKMLGKLIEKLAPHAETEWLLVVGGVEVTDSMRRGEQIQTLIYCLGAMNTDSAAQEIDRLLGLPTLNKLKFMLESTRHQLRLRQRESEFRFLSPQDVAQVLANREPASAADLTMLALDHLDSIAKDIRQDNDDGFRAFWNVENKKPTSQREENLCRDALLTRLCPHLNHLGIDCQPEKDHANDKRADLSLSYRTEFEIPIEIKRDSNPSLWTALRSQLINQYTIAPKAYGYGIYLVLWFGGQGMPRVTDGGKKINSPQELQTRLEAQLDPEERQRIFIRVLDVSWPKRKASLSCHSDGKHTI